MNTENLNVSLAETIRTAHEAAIAAAESARGQIGDALTKAADVGLLVEEAKSIHHGGFHKWLREYIPTLTVEQAEAYFGVHKVRAKRNTLGIDHRQLKLLGIIGDEDITTQGGSSTAQRADHGRWVKWCAHIEHHFRDVDKARPIEYWSDFERKALVDQLDPLVKLWERAKGIATKSA